jgi:hypothetical protein
LFDLSNCNRALEAIREISWVDGIGKLIDIQDREPVVVSLIFSYLHTDPQIRAQINAVMELSQINHIVKLNGNEQEWTDLSIPEQIRRRVQKHQQSSLTVSSLEQ